MEVIAAAAAWAISSTCRNVPGAGDWLGMLCPQQHDLDDLAQRLSPGAEIYYPGSDQFKEATLRWSSADVPGVRYVVVPASENDVAETVKFANEVDVPFLAQSGGHGRISTVAEMKDGIEIWLHKLRTVEVSQDGKTARVGGGALSKDVIDDLWAAGKQTVTGTCECTSLLGPGLGGGHGLLQGRYGLTSDQFVSLNVVLADGTLNTIDKNSDLWWAMRGAGHNFGIVTSATIKIYDVKHSDWAYQNWFFPGTEVERLYEAVNEHLLLDAKMPVELVSFSAFMNVPEIDPENSIILLFVFQEGATVVDERYTKPFDALNAIISQSGTGPYVDISKWASFDIDGPTCRKSGLGHSLFPIDILKFDIPAQRKIFDLFSSSTHETPGLNSSTVLLENYSLEGVKAVPNDSSAFPNRGDNIIVGPVMSYPADDPKLKTKARELGEGIRGIIHEADGREELHAYVNYAHGSEKKESMYGYEKWRQDRLWSLKNKYDPDRKFSFYAPIA